MRLARSVDLLWPGWKIARNGPPRMETDKGAATNFLGRGCLLRLHPKSWAMALGAAASFAGLTSGPLPLAALLGLAFGLAAPASLSLRCLAVQLFARLLRTVRQCRAWAAARRVDHPNVAGVMMERASHLCTIFDRARPSPAPAHLRRLLQSSRSAFGPLDRSGYAPMPARRSVRARSRNWAFIHVRRKQLLGRLVGRCGDYITGDRLPSTLIAVPVT